MVVNRSGQRLRGIAQLFLGVGLVFFVLFFVFQGGYEGAGLAV